MANRREEERERLREAREEREKDAGAARSAQRLMIGYGGRRRDRADRDRRRSSSRSPPRAAAAAAAAPTSTSQRLDQRRPARTRGVGRCRPPVKVAEPAGGREAGRLRRAPATSKKRATPTSRPELADARLQDQPADLGQPRRTALPAGRRRLQRNARRDRLRPLARARPAGDPVRARPRPKRTSWR